ncbi:MAG: diacylglycerol kinase family protein [Candidatus Daviesbacteria bacterium]|nr:diacylglycerol kinase family protein [Candidatus Daviesbacteria bacterium]
MDPQKSGTILKSFKFALEGILAAVKTERNFRLGIVEAIVIIILGIVFNITRIEWVIIILLTGLVLTAELTNSALEIIVDSFTDKYHPGAKRAKDIAAGAVVILIITAAIVGTLIFLPYIEALRG